MEPALDDALFIIELVGNAGAEAIAGAEPIVFCCGTGLGKFIEFVVGADAIIFCGGTGLGKLIEFVVGAGAIMLL